MSDQSEKWEQRLLQAKTTIQIQQARSDSEAAVAGTLWDIFDQDADEGGEAFDADFIWGDHMFLDAQGNPAANFADPLSYQNGFEDIWKVIRGTGPNTIHEFWNGWVNSNVDPGNYNRRVSQVHSHSMTARDAVARILYTRGINKDTTPPTASVTEPTPGSTQSSTSFTVRWSGSDTGGSWLTVFDVQYKDGATGNWIDWLTQTIKHSENFTGQQGHTYYF